MGRGEGGACGAGQAPVLEGFKALILSLLLHPDFVLGENSPLEQPMHGGAVLAHRRILVAGCGQLVWLGETFSCVLDAVVGGPAARDRLLG